MLCSTFLYFKIQTTAHLTKLIEERPVVRNSEKKDMSALREWLRSQYEMSEINKHRKNK